PAEAGCRPGVPSSPQLQPHDTTPKVKVRTSSRLPDQRRRVRGGEVAQADLTWPSEPDFMPDVGVVALVDGLPRPFADLLPRRSTQRLACRRSFVNTPPTQRCGSQHGLP